MFFLFSGLKNVFLTFFKFFLRITSMRAGHGDAVDALSSCSSLSSVHSSSPSDVDHRGARLVPGRQSRRSVDTATDSGSRVGENVYSRIKEPGGDIILLSLLLYGAITSKIKHAIKLKTGPARLAQLLQPSLAFCFSLQPITAKTTNSTT